MLNSRIQKLLTITALGIVMLVQTVSAHEGLIPHSHGVETKGIPALVVLLVICAVIAGVAGWTSSRNRR